MENKEKEKDAKQPLMAEITEEDFNILRQKAEERDEYYKKWLSIHAEYENTRRRIEKEKVEYMKFANESIIARLFPIVDNFDMALSAMKKAEDKAALMDGISLVQKEFHKILEDNGVQKIETKAKQFDHNVHEAVLVIETSEEQDGMVIEELRAGYTWNGRLLRPAQVKVARNIVRSTAPDSNVG